MPSTAIQVAWYVTTAPGKPETGPLRTRELKAWAADGRLTAAMLVRRIGMPRPVLARNVQGLLATGPVVEATAAEAVDVEHSIIDAAVAPAAAPATAAAAITARMRRDRAGNPFAPPTARTSRARDGDAAAGSHAGFGTRFLASLIDGLILIPLNGLCLLLMLVLPLPVALFLLLFVQPVYKVAGEAFGGTVGKRAMRVRLTASDGSRMDIGRALLRNLAPLLSSALAFAALLQAGLASESVVVRIDESGAGISRDAVAVSALMVGAYALVAAQLIACLVVAFTRRKQGLHDLMAGTVCVFAARRRRADTRQARTQRSGQGAARTGSGTSRGAPRPVTTARTRRPAVVTTRRFQRRPAPLRQAS